MADIAQTEDGSCVMGRRRCVLIEGAPGSGKSTLAWKLCHKWGKGNHKFGKGKTLQQYRLVVLLRLKEKRVKGIRTVEDLFRIAKPEAIEEIVQNEGKGVLLLLDGWDELPAELREEESFFLDLIKGQMLKDATVVVTSRPHASEIIACECKDRIFQHIQVLGFSEDNVQAYMRSNTGDDDKLLQGLQTYTSCYPHIRSMMYNPLSAAIVVEVYKNNWKEKTTIPKTMTELYSSLIRTLLLRYLKEHPTHRKRKWKRRLQQFTDLPPDVYQQLCKISKIAYEGISNKQQVIFSDLPDDFDSLGLMQGVPELYVDEGTALSYNFLHLTIQEFLAAFHLSKQSTEQQVEMFRLYQNTSSYKMVLKFMAGLTSLKGFSEDALLSLLQEGIAIEDLPSLDRKEIKRDGHVITISLDFLHLLFEGRNWNILNTQSQVYFPTSGSNPYRSMSPFDSYILGYILTHTKCQWSPSNNNQFPNNRINAAMFARGTREDEDQHPAEAGTISLHSKPGCCRELLTASKSVRSRTVELFLEYEVLESHYFHECDNLSQSLPSLSHLKSLKLRGCIISSFSPDSSIDGDKGSITHLSIQFKNTSPLNEAYCLFSDNTFPPSLPPSIVSSPPPPFTSTPGSRLIKALQSHNILKRLILQNTGIGVVECAALVEWLSSPTSSLEELNLSRNRFNSEATKLIITALRRNCTLRKFNIAGSRIPTQLLAPLLGLPLVSLYLFMCFIGPEEARVIAKTLCSNTVLEVLGLSDNPIGDKGAASLAEMLKHSKNLKALNLKITSITAQGACEIARALSSNTYTILEKLNLEADRIGDKGASALAEMLLHNKSLKALNLKITSLTTYGVCEIAGALCSNTVLEELNLEANPIGDEAVTALAEMVLHNKSLKCLILSISYLTAQGIEVLREAEQHNSTLKIHFRSF